MGQINITSENDFIKEFNDRKSSLQDLEELESYLSLKIRRFKTFKKRIKDGKEEYLNYEIARISTIDQFERVQKYAKKLRDKMQSDYYEYFYVTCKLNLDKELFEELKIKTSKRFKK